MSQKITCNTHVKDAKVIHEFGRKTKGKISLENVDIDGRVMGCIKIKVK